MPRVLALCWDLAGSGLADGVKKATLLHFDGVMGLGLANWQPEAAAEIPAEILAMAHKRQQARAGKDWATADHMRDELAAAGYEVEDTPEGPRVSPLKS